MSEITAKEIAKRLGLSPSAVSLALNGKPGVSEKTRTMVVDMAAELGYSLPRGAVTTNTAKQTVCFLIFVDRVVSVAEHSSMQTFVLRGIESAASAAGYSVIVRYFYAGQPLHAQAADLLREVCGIIMLGTEITQQNMSEVSAFIESVSAVPVVVLDNTLLSDRVDCVANNNFLGGQQAANHLISQNYRSIGYLRSKLRIQPFDLREAGLRNVLDAAGLPVGPVVNVGISAKNALEDFCSWLDTNPQLPDAFFAENDVVGVAAIRACNMYNIAVPEQLAIVGFDDIPICDMTFPPLSTIHVFKESLGQLAFHAVHMRLMNGQNSAVAAKNGLCTLELSTLLQVRESSVANPAPTV